MTTIPAAKPTAPAAATPASTRPEPIVSPPSFGTPTGAEVVLRCADVWKQYYFHSRRAGRMKDVVLQALRLQAVPPPRHVWSLQAFNLELRRGETVGIVGNNGAGKSTLLKLLSRIHPPTRGNIQINGRLSAIIELGAGFHDDLSGRDNVYLAASFLGLRRREVDALYGRIVDFCELGPHMDSPVKYFSSGMRARLGFSIAINVDPDVLLIDEVLAVGDQDFQPKCKDAIRAFQRAGKGIILVSHDLDAVRSLCQRVIWLKAGVTMADGPPHDAIDAYLEHFWPGCTQR